MRRWRRFLPVIAIGFFLLLHDDGGGEAAESMAAPAKAPGAATPTDYTVVKNPTDLARR